MHPNRPLLLASLIAALLASAAGAAPHVTLKLENVTLLDALRALQRETGWRFRLDQRSVAAEITTQPGARRASFDWENVSVGRACRELGETFDYTPRSWSRWDVNFESGRPPAPVSPYRASRAGFTFTATRVGRYVAADHDLAGVQGPVQRTGSLALLIRPDHGDPDVIRGLEAVQVVTDAGPARLTASDDSLQRRGAAFGRLEEWEIELPLSDLPAGARKLAHVSGDLLLYRMARTERVEVPLPAPAVPFQRSLGPVKVNVTRIEAPAGKEVRVDLEGTWPEELRLGAPDGDDSPVPLLRLKSGRLDSMHWEADTETSDGRLVRKLRCTGEYDPDDPPAALVWDLTIQGEPGLRVPFRLENIPLPVLPGDAAAPARPAPGARPTVDRATGTLVAVVRPASGPAEGELAFGLRRKLPNGAWGPVRWQSVATDGMGTARLERVAPGTYQVSRKFQARAADGSLRPVSGRWENAAVEVQVKAGQAITLPPLKQLR